MPKKTTNHEYEIPQEGETNWDEPLNANFRQFETDIEIRDARAKRNDYQPTDGAKFFATDTGDVFVGDGNAWLSLEATGTLPSFGGKASVGIEVEFQGTGAESTALSVLNLGKGPGLYAGATDDTAIAADGRNLPAAVHAAGVIAAGPDFNAMNLVLDGNDGSVEIGGEIAQFAGGTKALRISEGTLHFGSSTDAAAETPMLMLYGGGTENPERPVVVHSPSFDDYGLFYDDPADDFVFRGGAGDRVRINLEGGTELQVKGDATIDGTLQASTKNFVQSVDTDDGEKEVTYTSVESDTPHTETSGVTRLDDGRAEVELPDHFAWVTDAEEPLVAQVTPHARERVHPQVTERSTHRVVVEDFSDGTDDYEVSYTVKGTREGYTDQQVVSDPTDAEPDRGAE